MVDYQINQPQAWLFQMANAFLFISYIVPSLLGLRIFLACAGLCFILWGWIILPFSIDTVLWNSFFLTVNLTQAFLILWRRRPVKLDEDREALYQALFAGGSHKISRADFKQLTAETPFRVSREANTGSGDELVGRTHTPSLERKASYAPNGTTIRIPSQLCYVREYKQGELVASVGQRAETLSVILRGDVLVEALDSMIPAAVTVGTTTVAATVTTSPSPNPSSVASPSQPNSAPWRPVALLHPFEFLDSPEWVSRSTQRKPVYSVAMRVTSASGARVLHWNSQALDAFFARRGDLSGIMLGVVGVDLARKVFSANVAEADLEKELLEHTMAGGSEACNGKMSAAKRFHTLSPEIPLVESGEKSLVQQVSGSTVVSINPLIPTTAADGSSTHRAQSPNEALVSLMHLARGTKDPNMKQAWAVSQQVDINGHTDESSLRPHSRANPNVILHLHPTTANSAPMVPSRTNTAMPREQSDELELPHVPSTSVGNRSSASGKSNSAHGKR